MKRIIAAALCAAALSPAAALAADTYEIAGKDGKKIGELTLTAAPHGVLIDIEVQPGSLTAGKHGLHFHETADCSDVGQYKKSGSHAGHGEGKHGLLNPNGPEPGDLPNLIALSDGSAQAGLYSGLIKLDDLKAENGSALIIHADKDDHISQPIGKAGDRVACAAIK
ncbi:superoxide dismutase family protein [Methylopila sp. M107]|uniref:superoxide dismutase family protein n=1 Tax=Methylopila sp. M107 TaxID=1101190 RepID=UPI0003692D9A|nr:superoxide dismutase family protein [Methylopila sp. M107]